MESEMETCTKLRNAIAKAIDDAADKETTFSDVALALTLCLSDILEELSPEHRLASIGIIAVDQDTTMRQAKTLRDIPDDMADILNAHN